MYFISSHLSKKFGIYSIFNIKNNRVYIGSTTRNFKKRYNEHVKLFRNYSHFNDFLKNDYNVNPNNFIFQVLECIENKENVIVIEQMYLNYFYDNQDKNKYLNSIKLF